MRPLPKEAPEIETACLHRAGAAPGHVDLCAAGSVGTLHLTPAEGDLRFDVTLADE